MSVDICTVMTRSGYDKEIRLGRNEKYSEYNRLVNAHARTVTQTIAGSKAEWLTCWLESDHDFLFVLNNFLCVEAGISIHTIPDYMNVFRMDTRVYPGAVDYYKRDKGIHI
ncbi:hypothetical protein DPMN_048689 [Dreissena polymorpha]|uniref:Uncharacterized protein n=1 Tax=Dreissena polymorpha TaxID=45954 RepID=A0A9D4DC43_DREPO|nr:hypothetical protein DPMN_048689 [Dreissena polymorpha]